LESLEDRFLLWLLSIEEYGVTIEYLLGKKNVAANVDSLPYDNFVHKVVPQMKNSLLWLLRICSSPDR
jgi:hypothetical protein